jgi:hypothetical protein
MNNTKARTQTLARIIRRSATPLVRGNRAAPESFQGKAKYDPVEAAAAAVILGQTKGDRPAGSFWSLTAADAATVRKNFWEPL